MTHEARETRMTVRLPDDAVAFLDAEAKKEFTSRNAQIVRAIRSWMSAATGEGLGNSAPVAAIGTGARQGTNPSIQGAGTASNECDTL